MLLADAVEEAVTVIKEGRDHEFPPGRRAHCKECPIALFLSAQVGQPVAVGFEWIIAEDEELVNTPPEIEMWIDKYDSGDLVREV